MDGAPSFAAISKALRIDWELLGFKASTAARLHEQNPGTLLTLLTKSRLREVHPVISQLPQRNDAKHHQIGE